MDPNSLDPTSSRGPESDSTSNNSEKERTPRFIDAAGVGGTASNAMSIARKLRSASPTKLSKQIKLEKKKKGKSKEKKKSAFTPDEKPSANIAGFAEERLGTKIQTPGKRETDRPLSAQLERMPGVADLWIDEYAGADSSNNTARQPSPLGNREVREEVIAEILERLGASTQHKKASVFLDRALLQLYRIDCGKSATVPTYTGPSLLLTDLDGADLTTLRDLLVARMNTTDSNQGKLFAELCLKELQGKGLGQVADEAAVKWKEKLGITKNRRAVTYLQTALQSMISPLTDPDAAPPKFLGLDRPKLDLTPWNGDKHLALNRLTDRLMTDWNLSLKYKGYNVINEGRNRSNSVQVQLNDVQARSYVRSLLEELYGFSGEDRQAGAKAAATRAKQSVKAALPGHVVTACQGNPQAQAYIDQMVESIVDHIVTGKPLTLNAYNGPVIPLHVPRELAVAPHPNAQPNSATTFAWVSDAASRVMPQVVKSTAELGVAFASDVTERVTSTFRSMVDTCVGTSEYRLANSLASSTLLAALSEAEIIEGASGLRYLSPEREKEITAYMAQHLHQLSGVDNRARLGTGELKSEIQERLFDDLMIAYEGEAISIEAARALNDFLGEILDQVASMAAGKPPDQLKWSRTEPMRFSVPASHLAFVQETKLAYRASISKIVNDVLHEPLYGCPDAAAVKEYIVSCLSSAAEPEAGALRNLEARSAAADHFMEVLDRVDGVDLKDKHSAVKHYASLILVELARAEEGFSPKVPEFDGQPILPDNLDNKTLMTLRDLLADRMRPVATDEGRLFVELCLRELQGQGMHRLVSELQKGWVMALGGSKRDDVQQYSKQMLLDLLDPFAATNSTPPRFLGKPIALDRGPTAASVAKQLDNATDELLVVWWQTANNAMADLGIDPKRTGGRAVVPSRNRIQARKYIRQSLNQVTGNSAKDKQAELNEKKARAREEVLKALPESTEAALSTSRKGRQYLNGMVDGIVEHLVEGKPLVVKPYSGKRIPMTADATVDEPIRQARAIETLVNPHLTEALKKAHVTGNLDTAESVSYVSTAKEKALQSHITAHLHQLAGVDQRARMSRGRTKKQAVKLLTNELNKFSEAGAIPPEQLPALKVYLNNVLFEVKKLADGKTPKTIEWDQPTKIRFKVPVKEMLGLLKDGSLDQTSAVEYIVGQALAPMLVASPHAAQVKAYVSGCLQSLHGEEPAPSKLKTIKDAVTKKLKPPIVNDTRTFVRQLIGEVGGKLVDNINELESRSPNTFAARLTEQTGLPLMREYASQVLAKRKHADRISAMKDLHLFDQDFLPEQCDRISERLLALVFPDGPSSVPTPELSEAHKDPYLSFALNWLEDQQGQSLEKFVESLVGSWLTGAAKGYATSALQEKEEAFAEMGIDISRALAAAHAVNESGGSYKRAYQILVFQLVHTAISQNIRAALEPMDDEHFHQEFMAKTIAPMISEQINSVVKAWEEGGESSDDETPNASSLANVSPAYSEVGMELVEALAPGTLGRIDKVTSKFGLKKFVRKQLTKQVQWIMEGCVAAMVHDTRVDHLAAEHLSAQLDQLEGKKPAPKPAKSDKSKKEARAFLTSSTLETAYRVELKDSLKLFIDKSASRKVRALVTKLLKDDDFDNLMDELASGLSEALDLVVSSNAAVRLSNAVLDELEANN